MIEEILLSAIAIGQLIIIICMLLSLRYLRLLSDNTEKLEAIAENLENLRLLSRLEGQ